ncbi:MAG: VWA domain-containing protein [Roseiflexus sp.]|uniref:VWA domain-containing protein n=1 Tax=Roseiflexus sp. TaxID=2562120 RepID=UPI0025F1A083|nr:VWA domain-containing protein [Roseiflexus sp.]MCL6542137.1 VWA domain-containing protein [Roseiflexus sp.]
MNTQRTPETDRLYDQGVAFMRAARWEEAIALLSQVRGLPGAYPDVEALIADAQLKLEIEQAGMPPAAPPPKPRPPQAVVFGGIAATALIGLIVAAVLFVRLDASGVSIAAQPLVLNLTFPTLAPTRTPTPAPTRTPQPLPPTATPPPSVILPGTLGVRMAPGERTTRTIGNLAVILDASGSMLARIDGTPKTVIARQSLIALVNRLPETTNVALRTYGHRRADDCNDTELIQPPGPLQRNDLIARINAIRPVNGGRTPIAQSLANMAQDLAGIEGDVLIVLVSDGDETCGGDPVATTAMLRAANPRLRVSVVGFDIEQEEWRRRLEGIAASGGGAYFDAANAAQLADALDQAIALTYRVVDSQGVEVYQGRIGSTVRLPPGAYRVEIGGDAELTLETVAVESSTTTFVELREDQGALRATTVTDDGTKP